MSSTTSDTTGRTPIDPQLEWLTSSERPLFGVAAGLFGSAAAFQILGWRWLATLSGKLRAPDRLDRRRDPAGRCREGNMLARRQEGVPEAV
jgi:hypothetical protein